MTIINRYLTLQVLIGLVVATAVILPAFSFLDLLEQLGKVGTGTYRVQDALLDTSFLLPRRFIQLAPFIALLGTVFALGRLAVNLELTALRVAGLSLLVSVLPRSGLGWRCYYLLLYWSSLLRHTFNRKPSQIRQLHLERLQSWARGWVSGLGMSRIYYALVRCRETRERRISS